MIVGHGAEQLTKKITEQSPPSLHVTFVEQSVQRGTGDAVIVGLTAFHDDEDIDEASTIVVLNGDMPLLQGTTIARLVERHEEPGAAGTVLTARLPDGRGYAAITEAALTNYSGMALKADGRRGFTVALGHTHPPSYPFRLRYAADVEQLSKPAAISGTITNAIGRLHSSRGALPRSVTRKVCCDNAIWTISRH